MKKLVKNLISITDHLDTIALIKETIEEWQYHGYTSFKDYERVKKMRRPELYKKPAEEKINKIEPKPDLIEPIGNRKFGKTLNLLEPLVTWGSGIKKIARSDDITFYIETHGRINPDNLTDTLDFDKNAGYNKTYEKRIGSFVITIHNYDSGAQIYITGNKEDLDKLENQELE